MIESLGNILLKVRVAMGMSAVSDCGISWSYSLTIFVMLVDFLNHLQGSFIV